MRRYHGPLQGVILDWAGTVVDYGCMAPLEAIIEAFHARGIALTVEEARKPMGAAKRDHISQLLATPSVEAQWRSRYQRSPTENDVQHVFDAFTSRLIGRIAEHATLIPGTRETAAAMKHKGWKIGSCTGYTRSMMEPLLAAARAQGYEPDALVCPEDAGGGRPSPWMCYLNASRLGVYPMESLVKIGDTAMDILEGINAGMWTIGVAKTGNELGLTEAEAKAVPVVELNVRLADAYQRLDAAGAHYVVDSLVDAPPLLEEIDARLRRGEHPKDDGVLTKPH